MTVPSIGARTTVTTAIATASQKTGIDFNYLLGQAQVESGLRADARARTSSATGLYQFIEQSWLGVVKEHGQKHGLGWAADSIRQTANGRFTVADAATRQAILSLRNDPQAASLMAAEHASDNKASLEASLGRETTGTDLYMAHFLGLGGARKFLRAMDADPTRGAASMFPAAARANRNIFYTSDGSQRTLGQIYERFAGKLDRGAAAVGATGLASGNLDAKFQTLVASLGDDVEVVLGNEAVGQDRGWLTTLDRLQSAGRLKASTMPTANPLRPTPETAKLAYLMLARLGA
ncbi:MULTISPECIES: lytic transglycosylase domain-containing protein [unclassified Sphingomonas]|uniref:lytic transglycosylase domain-containing protein n=1 Tax=unclassified Sphingomonas TaxID=196159 RepID=UPI002150D1F3|nr:MULTISPECIES: lytic transglycosylase domain-containing protein [unclassified Sphingomonas]MCR5870509.1 lytic transglycosylase domain-containing protein [Sphingomonas sp. J344]UUY01145.1 lytic transglycosylase domain-containing protein [Sphingomonas sp. J315]